MLTKMFSSPLSYFKHEEGTEITCLNMAMKRTASLLKVRFYQMSQQMVHYDKTFKRQVLKFSRRIYEQRTAVIV